MLGALPTITQPLLSIVIAVLNPTPPGHCGNFCGNCANVVVSGAGLQSTIDARSLQVRQAVEIVNQHIALLDLSGRNRRHDHCVRTDVAIVRDGRRRP
jgi:hypothetical protein